MDVLPVSIVAYAGYRNERRLHLLVRVLRHEPPRDPPRSAWAKFRTLMRLYASREVAGVELRLDFGDEVAIATTNSEGYAVFEIALTRPHALPARTRWERASVTACSHSAPDGSASAPVLTPGRAVQLAIISDLDDTVLETGLWNIVRNWRRVLASSPSDRVAVPGVEDLFRHVAGGAGGIEGDMPRAPKRPIFYVSSSPWNLYGFLTEFLSLNRLPAGPMMLRDWGFNRETLLPGSHGAHKARAIGALLGFYPSLRFVLIGDDSQGDVAAYAQAVARHPSRVAGVFIRNVHDRSLCDEEADAIAAMRAAGVPVWVGSAFDAGDAMLSEMRLAIDPEVANVSHTLELSEIEQDAPSS